jgi:hypothetical protein
MTTGIDIVYDATHANIRKLPPHGSYAGYVTGSGSVPWTAADFARFPDAIRIDQTPASTQWDSKADVDDFERGTVTLGELAPRAKERLASFHSNARPGQRMPLVYASASDITNVVNALIKGGVTSGVGLWVANWNLTQTTSIGDVLAASGPFPIAGVQFHNAGAFDISVFSIAWLTNRSGAVKPPPSVRALAPPGQWLDAKSWTWTSATLTGHGLDRKMHRFDFVPNTGKWARISLSKRYQAADRPSCLRGGPLGKIELVRHTNRRHIKMEHTNKVTYVALEMARYGGPQTQLMVNGKFFGNLYRDALTSHYVDRDLNPDFPFVGVTLAPSLTSAVVSVDVRRDDVHKFVQMMADMQPPF